MPPKDLPEDSIAFVIKAGTETITPQTHPIVSVTVDTQVNKIAKATIVIEDGEKATREFAVCNSHIFTIGENITIEAGYGQTLFPIFEGIIVKQGLCTKYHTDATLVIECRHAAYRTTLVPHTCSFSTKTDADVIKEILQVYSPLKSTVDLDNTAGGTSPPEHEILLQQEVTDWDFILLRAEANGCVVTNGREKHQLSIAPPNLKQSPVASFTYGREITAMDIHMDARDQWEGVTSYTWAAEHQEAQMVSAKDPAESSFGDMSYKKLAAANKQQEMALYHAGMLAENELETLGTALLQFSRLAKIQGTITVPGMADLDLGDLVTIDTGAKDFTEGNAYVSGIEHQVSEGKFQTTLTLGLPCQRHLRKYNDVASLPAAGMLPAVQGLQIGIVKKLTEDPRAALRVGVHLPMVHEEPEDIVWCRVASPYASKETGFFFMPEIDDEVTVGALHGDPRSLIVLGSLYAGKQDSDSSTSSGASSTSLDFATPSTKSIITANSKLAIHLDDEKHIITLTVPGKNKAQANTITISGQKNTITVVNGEAGTITLAKEGITIKSAKDITMDAQGAINLKAGKDIVVEAGNEANLKGNNVSMKAGMKATVEGSSSAEVKGGATTVQGSATVTIEGAIVKIN